MIVNISVQVLELMSTEDAAMLPPAVLLDLQRVVEAELEIAKKHAKALGLVFSRRYAEVEKQERLVKAKPTGVIRFDDDNVEVVAEAPKKVEWDRDKLAAALRQLEPEIAERYGKWTITVEERRFAEAPARIKTTLEPARTVSVGKSSYHIEPKTTEPQTIKEEAA